MRRLSMVVAAAVASAMIVVAITALDAVGANGRSAKPKDDFAAKLAQCLRDHGVAVPRQQPSLAVARACKDALAGDVRKPADATADVRKLTACLRAHGAQPPSAADDLKRWILQHESDTTVASALKECGIGPPPSCGDKDEEGAAPVAGAKDGEA